MEYIILSPRTNTKDIVSTIRDFQKEQISIAPDIFISMLTYCKIKVPTAAMEHLKQVNKNGTVSIATFNKQYMTSLTNAVFKLKNYRV